MDGLVVSVRAMLRVWLFSSKWAVAPSLRLEKNSLLWPSPPQSWVLALHCGVHDKYFALTLFLITDTETYKQNYNIVSTKKLISLSLLYKNFRYVYYRYDKKTLSNIFYRKYLRVMYKVVVLFALNFFRWQFHSDLFKQFISTLD